MDYQQQQQQQQGMQNDQSGVYKRVNKKYLPSFVGQTVLLPCIVNSIQGTMMQVMSTDKQIVNIILRNPVDIEINTPIEVFGIVNESLNIDGINIYQMKGSMDLAVANTVIEYINGKYSALF
ncbi:hypothetical protein WA158_001994 [Blastocystis sp. Blastoise]